MYVVLVVACCSREVLWRRRVRYSDTALEQIPKFDFGVYVSGPSLTEDICTCSRIPCL